MQKHEDKYIMFVGRDKTSKDGPAPLKLSENLKTNLEVYMKHIRQHFVRQDKQAIFLTDAGIAFPAGMIGKQKMATGKKNNSTKLLCRKVQPSSKSSAQVHLSFITHSREVLHDPELLSNGSDGTQQAADQHAATGHAVNHWTII